MYAWASLIALFIETCSPIKEGIFSVKKAVLTQSTSVAKPEKPALAMVCCEPCVAKSERPALPYERA